jgi:pyrroloquinoline quinone (PQQ) biosynthesis protein C
MSAEREVSYEAAMIDGGPHGAGDPTVLAILGPNVVTPDGFDAARRRLADLCQAAPLDREAFARYHATMYALYERRDVATATRRAWLAGEMAKLEESMVADIDWPQAMSVDAFREHVNDGLSMRARMGNAMSAYLFGGANPPDRRAARTYVLHHWYRSRRFFDLLVSFAARTPLDLVGVLYENLAEETGALPGTRPHPRMLEDLLHHFELPEPGQQHPTMPEAWAYLNNRSRSVRTEHPAWGLALLYSLEYSTTETHRNIHTMLVRLGVPEHARSFHALHMECDAEHANGVWRCAETHLRDAEGQRTFLRSLAEQQRLSRLYFGRIWDEIRAELGLEDHAPSASRSAP